MDSRIFWMILKIATWVLITFAISPSAAALARKHQHYNDGRRRCMYILIMNKYLLVDRCSWISRCSGFLWKNSHGSLYSEPARLRACFKHILFSCPSISESTLVVLYQSKTEKRNYDSTMCITTRICSWSWFVLHFIKIYRYTCNLPYLSWKMDFTWYPRSHTFPAEATHYNQLNWCRNYLLTQSGSEGIIVWEILIFVVYSRTYFDQRCNHVITNI